MLEGVDARAILGEPPPCDCVPPGLHGFSCPKVAWAFKARAIEAAEADIEAGLRALPEDFRRQLLEGDWLTSDPEDRE